MQVLAVAVSTTSLILAARRWNKSKSSRGALQALEVFRQRSQAGRLIIGQGSSARQVDALPIEVIEQIKAHFA